MHQQVSFSLTCTLKRLERYCYKHWKFCLHINVGEKEFSKIPRHIIHPYISLVLHSVLKSCFLRTQIWIFQLWRGLGPRPSGTPKYLGVVIFETTLKIFGEFRSKWAMGTSGSFKIVRTTASYFFSPLGHGKWAKTEFFRMFANYSDAKIFKRYPRMPYESWRPADSENVVVFVAIIF